VRLRHPGQVPADRAGFRGHRLANAHWVGMIRAGVSVVVDRQPCNQGLIAPIAGKVVLVLIESVHWLGELNETDLPSGCNLEIN